MDAKRQPEDIKYSIDGENITITLPIELLVFAANDMPDPCMRVVDKESFAKAFLHRLENYANGNDVEIGTTRLLQTFDDMLNDMYESGLDCLEEAQLPISLEG